MASLVPLEKAIEDQEHEQVSKLAKQGFFFFFIIHFLFILFL